MQRVVHANGVVTYTFDSLAEQPVYAHVSTRHSGVSPQPWNTLNFSVRRGDSEENVRINRARFAAAIGVDQEATVYCQQVHGTGLAKVDGTDAGRYQPGCDGLLSDSPQLPLSLVFADCTPVLLYDRRHHALGVVHAGWRGTVNGATEALLWSMRAAYATEPAEIVGCIGPSIGPESYEVGKEVFDLARAHLEDADALFTWPNGREERPFFNLWRANALQLCRNGVPENQIEISGIDTARTTEDFFSHRAEQGRCGLFGMVAWLGAPGASG